MASAKVIPQDDASADDDGLRIPKEKRSTSRYLTKFEHARIIGTRALQLSCNAKATAETHGQSDPMKIAMLEMEAGTIPLIVRRFMPDGRYEDWDVNELINTHGVSF